MKMSFLQKVILTAVFGALAACLVVFYRGVIQKADDELNGPYRRQAPIERSTPR